MTKDGNSGVYLRGIYEVQVADTYGRPLDAHNMGAIYSRIKPTVAAEKPAGEWQTMDITYVDRHATVILNGKKIIDNQPVLGCTGGAQFRKVVLPAALPSIFTGLRLGLGLAWFVIVVGEMTGVPQGLGAVIMDGRTLSRTELVICGMIVIGLAGFLSDKVVLLLMNRMLRWSPMHHV